MQKKKKKNRRKIAYRNKPTMNMNPRVKAWNIIRRLDIPLKSINQSIIIIKILKAHDEHLY